MLRYTYIACLFILLFLDSLQVEDILLRLKIRTRLLDIPSSVCWDTVGLLPRDEVPCGFCESGQGPCIETDAVKLPRQRR